MRPWTLLGTATVPGEGAPLRLMQRGDEVVTAGGVLGRINKINENYVTLEVASNVEIQVQRPSVQLVLPKGTLKNIQ